MVEVTVSLIPIPFTQAHAFHCEIRFRIPAPTFHKAQNISQYLDKLKLCTVKDQKL